MLYIIYNHNINVIYTCICNSLDTCIMSWTFTLTHAHTPLHSECGVSDVKSYLAAVAVHRPSMHIPWNMVTTFPSFPSSHLGLCQQPKNLILQLYQAIPTSIGPFQDGAAHIMQPWKFKENCLCSWVIQTYYYTHACPMKTVMLKVVHAESPQVGSTITIRPFWSSLQFASPDVRANHSLQKSY